MTDVIEPDLDLLHGKVVNEDSEMPVGGGAASDEPDQGDADSAPVDGATITPPLDGKE